MPRGGYKPDPLSIKIDRLAEKVVVYGWNPKTQQQVDCLQQATVAVGPLRGLCISITLQVVPLHLQSSPPSLCLLNSISRVA